MKLLSTNGWIAKTGIDNARGVLLLPADVRDEKRGIAAITVSVFLKGLPTCREMRCLSV